MIIVEYRRTMAGAKRRINEETPPPPRPPSTPRRDALIALYKREELVRARVELATEALRKARYRIDATIKTRTSAADLIEQVAFWHGLPVHIVTGQERSDVAIEARFDAMAAVAINCRMAGRKLSLHDIGHIFGRTHATVLNALRRRGLRA